MKEKTINFRNEIKEYWGLYLIIGMIICAILAIPYSMIFKPWETGKFTIREDIFFSTPWQADNYRKEGGNIIFIDIDSNKEMIIPERRIETIIEN